MEFTLYAEGFKLWRFRSTNGGITWQMTYSRQKAYVDADGNTIKTTYAKKNELAALEDRIDGIDCTSLFSSSVGTFVSADLMLSVLMALQNNDNNFYHSVSITFNGTSYSLKFPVTVYPYGSAGYESALRFSYERGNTAGTIIRYDVEIGYSGGWKVLNSYSGTLSFVSQN